MKMTRAYARAHLLPVTANTTMTSVSVMVPHRRKTSPAAGRASIRLDLIRQRLLSYIFLTLYACPSLPDHIL